PSPIRGGQDELRRSGQAAVRAGGGGQPVRRRLGFSAPVGTTGGPYGSRNRRRRRQPRWSQRTWVAASSSAATQLRSPTPLRQAARHENHTWPSTLAMAASVAGSTPSGNAWSSTRSITSVVA